LLPTLSPTSDGTAYAQWTGQPAGHLRTRRDSKWDTILSWMGHHFGSMGHQMGHHFAMMGHQMGHQSAEMGHKGTPMDIKMVSTSLWSSVRPTKGSPPGFWGLSGRKIRSTSQEWTRSHFAILAGCGILLPTSFQPSKGGDMVCARGPLGACVATCHNVGSREGSLQLFEVVPLCQLWQCTEIA
jgi:hypothetical protein